VDLRDALSTEEDLPESVLIGWPQGDGMSREGLWQLDVVPLEGDPSLLLDFAYQVVGGVGDRRQMLGHGARTRLIAAGRGFPGEACVVTHVVVDVALALEGALTFLDVAEGSLAQHFGFEAGMEALVLAHGLGKVGPAVADGDAQTDEPDTQRVIGMLGPIALGRAVVGDDLARQPEALEGFVQMTAHSLRSLVGAGRQAEREAGVIVEHGQRMAASGRYGEVALVVHLPQIVGRGPLEALEGPALLALAPIQPAMPAQDLGDRRDGRHLGVSQGRQAEGDLASTPCRMRTADRQD